MFRKLSLALPTPLWQSLRSIYLEHECSGRHSAFSKALEMRLWLQAVGERGKVIDGSFSDSGISVSGIF